MENQRKISKNSLVIKSFLRITVFPILIFTLGSWLIINLTEPIPYKQGCIVGAPEETRNDFLHASLLLVKYLPTTLVVLVNLISKAFYNKLVRNIIFLLPMILPIYVIILVVEGVFELGMARVFLYIGLTAICTVGIIIWNNRSINRKLTVLNNS